MSAEIHRDVNLATHVGSSQHDVRDVSKKKKTLVRDAKLPGSNQGRE